MVEVRSFWLAGLVVQSRVPDPLSARGSSFPRSAGPRLWSAGANEGRALERKPQVFNLGGRLPAFAALSHVSREVAGGHFWDEVGLACGPPAEGLGCLTASQSPC